MTFYHRLFVLVLATAATAFGGPVDFKGHEMGMTLSAFQQKHDRAVERDAGVRAPHIYLNPRLRAQGLVDCAPDIPFEHRPASVAGVKAEIRYYFVCDSLADWDLLATAGRGGALTWTDSHRAAAARTLLSRVQATFATDDFTTVKAALASKFGPPQSEATEHYENRLGASFAASKLSWTIGDTIIQLTERSTTIDRGLLTYVFQPAAAKEAQFESAVGKGAAQDL